MTQHISATANTKNSNLIYGPWLNHKSPKPSREEQTITSRVQGLLERLDNKKPRYSECAALLAGLSKVADRLVKKKIKKIEENLKKERTRDFIKLKITDEMRESIALRDLIFWHSKMGDGFYKSCRESKSYSKSDSWAMAWGVSEQTVHNRLKKVCTRHSSKEKWMEAKDKFRGMPFASYYDRIKRIPFYFKNPDFDPIKHMKKQRGRNQKRALVPKKETLVPALVLNTELDHNNISFSYEISSKSLEEKRSLCPESILGESAQLILPFEEDVPPTTIKLASKGEQTQASREPVEEVLEASDRPAQEAIAPVLDPESSSIQNTETSESIESLCSKRHKEHKRRDKQRQATHKARKQPQKTPKCSECSKMARKAKHPQPAPTGKETNRAIKTQEAFVRHLGGEKVFLGYQAVRNVNRMLDKHFNGDPELFEALCKSASTSRWARGESSSGFKPEFLWLVNPEQDFAVEKLKCGGYQVKTTYETLLKEAQERQKNAPGVVVKRIRDQSASKEEWMLRRRIHEKLGNATYVSWFEPLKIAIGEGRATFKAASEFAKAKLEEKMAEALRKICDALSLQMELRVVC